MKLDWNKIDKPIIALSPMADMTDSAYCRIVKEVTGESDYPIVFREMVSSEAVVRGNDKTLGMTEIHPDERPLVQQVFGADPYKMAESTRIIQEKHNPEGFDINMGCPVYKLTSDFNGAALMKDPKLASQIVKSMKSVVKVPLSVKIRAGWNDPKTCLDFAPEMEKAGADLITMHGRTRSQGYKGESDWKLIGDVKDRLSIPLLANGDIHTPESVLEALKITKADGVLIARGALGNPWFFKQTKLLLNGKSYQPVTLEERMDIVLKHLDYHIESYGEYGVVTFRKHIAWYFKKVPNIKPFKLKLHMVSTKQELIDVFEEIKRSIDVKI